MKRREIEPQRRKGRKELKSLGTQNAKHAMQNEE
jgi:hypothetical protein